MLCVKKNIINPLNLIWSLRSLKYTKNVIARADRTLSQLYRNQYIYLKKMAEDKSKNIIWIDMEVIKIIKIINL